MTNLEHTIKFDGEDDLTNHVKPIVIQARTAADLRQPIATTVPRNDGIFRKSNKAKIPRLKAPYRKRELDRFEDTYRTDGTVRNAINKKWNFILGANTYVNLDVNKEFQTDDERAAQLQKVMAFPQYQKAKDAANEILRKVNFRFVAHAAGVQASVYGRSCVEKVKDSQGNLVRLNILNSKLLGDVKINNETWDFLGVQYRDLPKSDDILWAENIFYITRNDVHVSPGSMYYGLSDLEPVIDGSETKRIIKQEDLKEIAKGLWAGFLWLKFKNPNVTASQIAEVVEAIKPGTGIATDQDVELMVQQVAQNSPMLLEMINELNLETARDLSIPSPLVGYENSQNYSNLVQTLIAWKESDLNAERRWLINLIEKQILNEIFRNEMAKQGITLPADLDQELVINRQIMSPLGLPNQNQNQNNNNKSPSSKLPFPSKPFPNQNPVAAAAIQANPSVNKEFPNSEKAQPSNSNNPIEKKETQEPTNNDNEFNPLGTPIMQVIPPAKLTYEIEDPNFETFEAKMTTVLQMYDKDLVSARKVLETADMEDQVEETELRLQQKEIRAQQMFNFQQDVFKTQVETNGQFQDKRTQLLERMQGKLDKVNQGPSVGSPQNKKPYPIVKQASSINIDDVDNAFVNNISDPEIINLYKDYLKAKTKAFTDYSSSQNE